MTLWRDTERTRKEMLAISPEDATEINLFIDVVNVASDLTANLSHFTKLAKTMSEAETVLNHFDFARRTMLYMGLNLEQWANKFKSEAIRNLLLDFSAKEYESYYCPKCERNTEEQSAYIIYYHRNRISRTCHPGSALFLRVKLPP